MKNGLNIFFYTWHPLMLWSKKLFYTKKVKFRPEVKCVTKSTLTVFVVKPLPFEISQ